MFFLHCFRCACSLDGLGPRTTKTPLIKLPLSGMALTKTNRLMSTTLLISQTWSTTGQFTSGSTRRTNIFSVSREACTVTTLSSSTRTASAQDTWQRSMSLQQWSRLTFGSTGCSNSQSFTSFTSCGVTSALLTGLSMTFMFTCGITASSPSCSGRTSSKTCCIWQGQSLTLP